jgi:adenosylmethionine-8-amino-7-oxononanoate aminotransferase
MELLQPTVLEAVVVVLALVQNDLVVCVAKSITSEELVAAAVLEDAVVMEVLVEKEEDLLLESSTYVRLLARHFLSLLAMKSNLEMQALVVMVVMEVLVEKAEKAVLRETLMTQVPAHQQQHGVTMKEDLVVMVDPAEMAVVPEVEPEEIVILYMLLGRSPTLCGLTCIMI